MLPCPFCGGDAEVVACKNNDSYLDRKKARNYYDYQQRKRYARWFPRCKNEYCIAHQVEDGEQGGTPVDCISEQEAIEIWNKRA